MKDKKKIIVPLLLAGVTATGVVSNINQIQQVSVQAEEATATTNIEGAEIKVGRFRAIGESGDLVLQDDFHVGNTIYLPKVSLEGETESDDLKIKYTIKKDSREFEPTLDESKGAYCFTADYQGYYDVIISAEGTDRVTTTLTKLSVFVEREEATIKLPTNSQYVIPAKVQKEQTNLKIPAPSVVYDNNGKDEEKTAKELADAGTTLGSLNVYLVNPDGETESQLSLDSTGSFYHVAEDKLASVGTYQIVYEYKNSEGKVISRLESNFQVVNNYDPSSIKLKMVFKSSLSEKGTVNTDISIPRVDVVDENVSSSDPINAYVKVTVKNVKTGEEVDVDYTNYTFRPKVEGTYSIKYQALIGVFGEDCKTKIESPGLPMVVTDNQAPKVIPTYAYTIDDEGVITEVNGETITTEENKTMKEVAEEKLLNRRVDIPSVAIKGEEFTIPALYATDNLDEIKDITLTRTYRNNSGSLSTVETPANQNATIKFKSTGSAEIRYSAKDKKGNWLGEVVYDVMVYDRSDIKDTETKLKLDIGTSLISDKEKTLTFAKPTATDTYDKYVDVQTYIKYDDSDEEFLLTETNAEGKYVLDIAKISEDHNKFTIIAKATVDSTLNGTRTNLVTTKEHTVTIQKTAVDNEVPTFHIKDNEVAPSIADATIWNKELFAINAGDEGEGIESIIADNTGVKIGGDGYLLTNAGNTIPVKEGSAKNKSPFDQGSNVLRIPTVVFEDKYDANLSISIEVKDRNGNVVDKVSQEYIEKTESGTISETLSDHKYIYTVSNASFRLSSYGLYTVTFKAVDYAGNTVVKTYGIRVNDKTAPTITVVDEDKFNKEIEVGEYFEVPTPTLMKEGENIGGVTNWEIYNVSSGAEYTTYNNGFIPTKEGTFFIRYYGEDEEGNKSTLEDGLFTITAKDTIAPTITLDYTQRFKSNVKWAPEENKSYMDIAIPVAFASDTNRGQVKVTYTVTGPDNSKPKVEDGETTYLKTFRANKEGKYTVVYSAIDDAGNESKVEKVICVGDCIAPTITWKDKDNDLKKEIELNTVYEFKVNDFLKLEDNDEENNPESTLRENVTVTLTSPDGTSVTNLMGSGSTGYKWEFSKTGNYTLKISVKDKVGNTTTETYTINVPAEEAETNKVSPVLGTVLIVLSVVVLGGVVVYFVASNKKKSTKKSTSKKK